MDENFDWGAAPTEEELSQLLAFCEEKGVALPLEKEPVDKFQAALERLEEQGLLWEYLF